MATRDDDATALYLAHLNPVTNAHVEIISDLRGAADTVKVMPVVFRDRDHNEVNSRSFPFSFECRREMLESVFGDSIVISDDYTFHAPFRRYMPPLLSPMSWRLRRQILRGVEHRRYFSYTGDRTEGYMLRLYGLKPRVGTRRPISAASVKERMYGAALAEGGAGGGRGPDDDGDGDGEYDAGEYDAGEYDRDADHGRDDRDGAVDDDSRGAGPGGRSAPCGWESDVPEPVARIIRREWDVVRRFAGAEDMTTRIVGMKFPKE